MKDLSQVIETLTKKTDGLIKAHRTVKDQLAGLESEHRKLKDKVAEITAESDRLREENKVLRMANAFRGDEERVAETKRRISQMVREIDKCIARLND